MKTLFILLFNIFPVFYIFAQTDVAPEIDIGPFVLNAMRKINSQQCLTKVRILSGEKYNGRATGSPGYRLTANYIAETFQNAGLLPADGTTFYQKFSVDRNHINGNNKLALEVVIGSQQTSDTLWVDYQLEKDYLPAGFSADTCFVSEAVFVGYGITSAQNNWNDYKNADIEDKIVLVLGGAPKIDDMQWGQSARMSHKVNFALHHGAAGFIGIGGPYATIYNEQTLPSVLISEKVANDFLKGTGYTVHSLRKEINLDQKNKIVPLVNRIKLEVDVELLKNMETMNIVGYLGGSDDQLKDEYIVIGAHADHIGPIGDRVFYGANDNASGTAVMLEIARAFSGLARRPRRSIVFIAFAGEEMGLLGSKYYTQHPLFPLNKTKAMINLDMVGSGLDGVMVVGGETFTGFYRILEQINDRYIHTNMEKGKIAENSDHYPFYQKGIPSVFLYSKGGPSTWHSTEDVPENVDGESMEIVGRHVFLTVWDLANRDKLDLSL